MKTVRRTFKKEGSFWYQAPGRVRWDIGQDYLAVKNDKEVLIASGEPYVRTWEHNLEHALRKPIRRVLADPREISRLTGEFYNMAVSVRGARSHDGAEGLVGMGNLEQMIHISKTLDEKLEAKAAELDATDPAKAKAVRETALFYVRQRTQDLLTQMAVSVQGYLALDLVKKNNVELVKGVDRASTTTVSALRTAVTVAQAMTNQKLVLEQITSLNTTTTNIIDSTSTLLREQTAQIHEQAASSTIPLETLQRAFQNIYDTMDEVDSFKVRALDSMKQTVNVLTDEVEKSKGYIARAEGQAQAQAKVASEPGLLALDN